MKTLHEKITVETSNKTDVVDFTEKAVKLVAKSNVSNGLFTASVAGSTASITTIEYESGVIEDLKRAIEKIAPENEDYAHNAKWGDGNGFSHVRAALLKASISVPIIDGQIDLGTWQQLVLLDFDNKPRNRKLTLSVIGT